MKTYIGVHPEYSVYSVGENTIGRILVDLTEEDLNRYNEIIRNHDQMQNELHEIFKRRVRNAK